MVWVVLFLAWFNTENSPGLKPTVTLAAIEDEEAWLQLPYSVDVDDRGNYYVVDVLARTVFVWDKTGRYVRRFGSEGQGPGELTFSPRGNGGHQGYIASAGDRIYVFDGTVSRVSVFDREGKFIRSIPFQLPGGRSEGFFVTPKHQFLVYQRSYFKDIPEMEVSIFDDKAQLQHKIFSRDDRTFSRKKEGGDITGIVYHAYAPTIYTHYDYSRNRVIIGQTGEPAFELYDLKGNRIQRIASKITPRKVTKADKEEYLEQAWIKDSAFLSADFPEYMAYYDSVLPLGDRGYLIYYQSRVDAVVKGWFIDVNGNKKQSFTFNCGEGGGLFGSRGHVIAVRTDEDGEYFIQEVSITE